LFIYKTNAAAAAASRAPAPPATLAAPAVNSGGLDADAELGEIGMPVVGETPMVVVVL
jgi:hypothetical protein